MKYSDIEKEFYFHLGLLSTKFAEIEANVISMLGGLITDNSFLINPIIEKNSLSQNIELLKKINLYKEFEKEDIETLINRTSKVRQYRNLFIHGLWGVPEQRENEVTIECIEQKVTPKMVKHGRMWTSGKEHLIKLSDIVSQINELDFIIALQKRLLEKI